MTEDKKQPLWQQSPPPSDPKKCPMCGHEPMKLMDPNIRWSTVTMISEKGERNIDTHVFRCEKCSNIQSFVKLLPEK